MKNVHCQVCPDKRKYQTKLSSSKNINLRLQSLIRSNHINTEMTISDQRKLNEITIFSGFKMMCPNCTEVNKNDISRLENEIKSSVLSIIKHNRESNDKAIEHQMISLLRGYYPELIHYYQREMRK